MSLPATTGSNRCFLEMEGTLSMRCLDSEGRVMEIWVLQDYEKKTWSKFQSELPMVTYSSNALLSHKRDIYVDLPCGFLFAPTSL
jgi:hypothetical protein